jgi:hypothetical protein
MKVERRKLVSGIVIWKYLRKPSRQHNKQRKEVGTVPSEAAATVQLSSVILSLNSNVTFPFLRTLLGFYAKLSH